MRLRERVSLQILERMGKNKAVLFMVSIFAVFNVCGCGQTNMTSESSVPVSDEVIDLAGEEETSDSGCYLSFGDIPKEEFVVKLEEAGIPEDTLLVGVNTVYDENAMVQLNHMLKEQGSGSWRKVFPADMRHLPRFLPWRMCTCTISS